MDTNSALAGQPARKDHGQMLAAASRWLPPRPRRRQATRIIDTTATRARRLTAVLGAMICGLLASAGIVPAASAGIIVPDPGGTYGTTRLAPASAATVRVVTAGGMAGWQIALIALAAALVAATAAVFIDRARAARRSASATTT